MAPKAKPAKKPGGGKPRKDQINGLDPAAVREFLDALHEESDDIEESNATSRGKMGRIYDKACNQLDVSKDAIKFLFGEERRQRKSAAKAAKMDSRARDSLERLAAAMPEQSPMAIWASNMARLAGAEPAPAAEDQ